MNGTAPCSSGLVSEPQDENAFVTKHPVMILKYPSHLVLISDVTESSPTMTDSVSDGFIGFWRFGGFKGLGIEVADGSFPPDIEIIAELTILYTSIVGGVGDYDIKILVEFVRF